MKYICPKCKKSKFCYISKETEYWEYNHIINGDYLIIDDEGENLECTTIERFISCQNCGYIIPKEDNINFPIDKFEKQLYDYTC